MIVRKRIKGLKRKLADKAAKPLSKLKIWILYPVLETNDPNLQYYYDFSQSREEYNRVFGSMGADWTWQPVTINNFKEVVGSIRKASGRKIPLVINLCDGDEINGTPGVGVIGELEKQRLIYTGANDYFYNITTSKIPMKRAFDESEVPTAKWQVIDGSESSMAGLCERLGAPLIIKPAVSGGSMGVSVKNVVYTDKELQQRVEEIKSGYRGWDLMTGGLFVEQFIQGPEFTSFIVGSYKDPRSCFVYPPVERIFHSSLPDEEKFLSFDRLWEIYEDENPMPGNENFYNYHRPDPKLVPELEKLSLDAYIAVQGTGYGRLDIRQDQSTGKLYVLEVNAQCGLSEDEDHTSIGAILRFSGRSFSELVLKIIQDAFKSRNLKLNL